MKRESLVVLLVAGIVACAGAQEKKDPALAPIKDDPKLPRVLLIGDSISIGYTLPTRKLLEGKANVHRIPTNGGPTINGLKNIDAWLGDKKWDVIHFNWGLHDLKMDAAGKHQVALDQYEKNLCLLITKMRKTGATLIWASTTPVPEAKVNPPRKNADVLAYNRAAAQVMKEEEVAVNDLYTFAADRLKDIQIPANVHFTPKGSQALAERVAAALEKALPRK